MHPPAVISTAGHTALSHAAKCVPSSLLSKARAALTPRLSKTPYRRYFLYKPRSEPFHQLIEERFYAVLFEWLQ